MSFNTPNLGFEIGANYTVAFNKNGVQVGVVTVTAIDYRTLQPDAPEGVIGFEFITADTELPQSIKEVFTAIVVVADNVLSDGTVGNGYMIQLATGEPRITLEDVLAVVDTVIIDSAN